MKILIMQYARAMWRRKWYAIAVAWAVCAVGWVVVSRMPDQYESLARVYMAPDEALTPLLAGLTVENDVDSRIDRMQRTLLRVENMRKVIRMTDLDNQVKSSEDTERMVQKLQKEVAIKPQTRNLFTVSFQNSSPQTAQAVVSTLLSIFKESNEGNSRTNIQGAQKFLQTQIDNYETQLREAERKKAEFRARYYELLPVNESGTSHLEDARATVQKVTDDLNDKKAERDNLQKALETLPPYVAPANAPGGVRTPGSSEGLSTQPDTRLAQLQTQLETELSVKTAEHPDVKSLRHQIEALTAQLKERAANAPKKTETGAAPVPHNVENPLYGEMKLKLLDAETAIAALQRKLVSAEDQRDKLENAQRQAPQVAAEYQNLDRDYEVLKKNYEELLGKREMAHLAEEADKKGEKVDFNVVDPPEVPALPIGPNRPLFLSIALLAGLIAGGAVALLLSQIDSSYSSTTSLQALGLPILGSISTVPTFDRRPQYWFAGAKGFAIACFALMLVYGGLLLVFVGYSHKLI